MKEKILGLGKIKQLVAISLLPLALTACFDDDDDDDPELAEIRVTHAVADAPAVNVYIDGTLSVEALDFKETTGFIELDAGEYEVEVRGILPGGDETEAVIGPVTLTFEEDTQTDIVAQNTLAEIAPLVLSREVEDVEDVALRIAHLAPGVPEVDVYATAPDATISASSAIGTIEFGETIDQFEVPAGEYRVRLALAGTETVAFDSGAVDLVAGQDLIVAAVLETSGLGDSPVELAIVDGAATATLFDTSVGSGLRVVHNASDVDGVDVTLDSFENVAVENATFRAFTDYLEIDAGDYTVEVAPTGNTTAMIDADVSLEQGLSYTAIAIGELNQQSLEILPLEDDRRAVATEARVRIIHGSATAGAVDIYVVAQEADISSATPAFTGVELKGDTGYVPLAAGSYDVVVTATGETTEAIRVSVTLEAGEIYTAIASDPDTGSALGLVALDGLAASQ